MLDLLICEKFVTISDLGSGESVSLQKHDGNEKWATHIVDKLRDLLPKSSKPISATAIDADLSKVTGIFVAFVKEKEADYSLHVHKDSTYTTFGSDWDRMMARYPKKAELESSLTEIALTELELKSIQSGDLTSPFFQKPCAPKKVQKALFLGEISQFHAAKLFIGFEAFANGHPIVSNTTPGIEKKFEKLFSDSSKSERGRVKELWNSLSSIDSQCVLVKTPKETKKIQTIQQLLHRNFGDFSYEEGAYIFYFLPPPELVHKFLTAIFKQNIMLANPVCGGLSQPEDFESPIFRDVFIPMPGVENPKSIHSLATDGLGATIHDALAHLIVEALNPRIPMIRVARGIKDNYSLWNEMLDRNTSTHPDLTHSQNFWRKMAKVVSQLRSPKLSHRERDINLIIATIRGDLPLYKKYGIAPLSKRDIDVLKGVSDCTTRSGSDTWLFLQKYEGA